MSWQRLNIGSRMNREVHVRFWERPEVKALRATRQKRRFDRLPFTSGLSPSTEVVGVRRHVANVAIAEIADAIRSEKICSSSNCGLDFARWIIPLYLGLFTQNGVQQRIVNFYLSIVADESKFAEFVHEGADARSGRANHLSQCFLADIQ